MAELGNLEVKNLEYVRQESPRFVRTSLAAAMTMGFFQGRFLRDAKLYTINLLLHYENGCVARCSYCGLNRIRKKKSEMMGEESFIRVEWPLFKFESVVKALQQSQCNHVERICISMITHRRAIKDTLLLSEKLLTETDKDVSVLISPSIVNKAWVEALKERGVDKLGVALDTATPKFFSKFRGKEAGGPHRWFRYWEMIQECTTIFHPSDISVHLIVGLGESEKEMLETVQRCYDLGTRPHLFSFFPEPGTALESHKQPPIETYRRIQLARYLIDQNISRIERMRFNEEGIIFNYGVKKEDCLAIVNTGKPFLTNGCDGRTRDNACNRPFSNSSPSQAINGELRNFPFQPTENDLKIIRTQLGHLL